MTIMNIIKKGLNIFIAAIAAVSIVSSCQKDDTLQYNNATMGNIVDGRFVSDQGNIFNVVDQTCPGDLPSMSRAFVICDVLNRTAAGAENEYDVRVNQIATVLDKKVVSQAEVTEEMLVQDPIHVEYAWISGGYMNLYIMVPMKAGSDTKHMINLVHEGAMIDSTSKEEISGTYRFTLRHNSNGDKITPEQTINYVLGGGYVSFPLNSFIAEKEAKFSIEWVWHKNVGAGLSSEKETRSLVTTYSAEGFQHAPKSTTAQQMAIVE